MTEELQLLDVVVLGNPLSDWGIAVALAAAIVLVTAALKPRMQHRLALLAARTETRVDDALLRALESTKLALIVVVGLYLGSNYLSLPEKAGKFLEWICTIAVFLQLGLWLGALLDFWLGRSRVATQGQGVSYSISAVSFLCRLVLWILIALLALDNLGVNVTALVAGLGVGGIAVALAVQNILGDMFASLSIVVDKPFVEGDFIIIENYMGTVENIGLKTTRVRGLDGEQIIFSNSDLLKARVRNTKRQYDRRVALDFGVFPDATPEQLEQIPGLVRQIIEAQKQVRFERAHFARIAENAMRFECIYWVLSPDFNLHMDIQQSINLALMRALRDKGVRLALAAGFFAAQPLRASTEPKAEPTTDPSDAQDTLRQARLRART